MLLKTYTEAEERFWRVLTEMGLLGQDPDELRAIAEDLECIAAGEAPERVFSPEEADELSQLMGDYPGLVAGALKDLAGGLSYWARARRHLGPSRMERLLNIVFQEDLLRSWTQDDEKPTGVLAE